MGQQNATAAFESFLDTKIVKLNDKHKAAIFAAAWLIPIIAFIFLFYNPKGKVIKKHKAEIAQLENEIQQVKAQAAELDKYKADKADTDIKFKAASSLLPLQKEIPSLLTNISSQGSNSGLNFISFTPGGEKPLEFYAEIPISITVQGPYHNIGLFLDKISKMERIITVPSLTLGSPQLENGEMTLSSSLSLVTYRFMEPKQK